MIYKIDDGLQYGRIEPSPDEWRSIFTKGEEVDLYGPVHLWWGCHNHKIIGYFFMEIIKEGYTLISSSSSFRELSSVKLPLLLDGNKVDYHCGGGGGCYFESSHFDANKSPFSTFLRKNISFSNSNNEDLNRHHIVHRLEFQPWKQYLSFSSSVCLPTSPTPIAALVEDIPSSASTSNISSTPVIPASKHLTINTVPVIMHVYTWEDPKPSENLNKWAEVVLATAKHFSYHHGRLNLIRYQIIVQEDCVDFFLAHPVIRKGLQSGNVVLLVKGNNPPRLKLEGFTPKWQALYENLSVLRSRLFDYHMPDLRIIFTDPDEYIMWNQDQEHEISKKIMTHATVEFLRFSTICVDCKDASNTGPSFLGDLHFQATEHSYVRGVDWHPSKKIMINPFTVGCMYVHWANCGKNDSIIRLSHTEALMLHFENLFHVRYDPNVTMHNTDNFVPINISFVDQSIASFTTQTFLDAFSHDVRHPHRKVSGITHALLVMQADYYYYVMGSFVLLLAMVVALFFRRRLKG